MCTPAAIKCAFGCRKLWFSGFGSRWLWCRPTKCCAVAFIMTKLQNIGAGLSQLEDAGGREEDDDIHTAGFQTLQQTIDNDIELSSLGVFFPRTFSD